MPNDQQRELVDLVSSLRVRDLVREWVKRALAREAKHQFTKVSEKVTDSETQ